MPVYKQNLVIIGSNEYCEDGEHKFFRSGLEMQMEDLSKNFEKVFHYSPKSKNKFTGFEFSDHVEILNFSGYLHGSFFEFLKRLPEYWNRMKEISLKHDSDLFMIFFPDSYIGLVSALYCKITRKNFFIRFTSNQMKEMRVRGSLFKKLFYFLVNPFYKFFLFWLFRDVVQIYSGEKVIDNDFSYRVISSNLKNSDIIKREIQNSSTKRILYVGRFDPYKGLNLLIESLNFIKSSNFVLDIVGFGSDIQERRTRDQILHSKFSKKINLVGYVEYGEKLFKFYDQADIFVVPALFETQGKTYLEAMSRGVAVLATEVGVIPDILTDGFDALLVKPGSVELLAKSIDRLISDFELRKKIIDNAYVTVKNLTIDNVTKITIESLLKHKMLQ